MKMDVDSILYIVITLVILVFSGLSGRRKKRARMMEAEANANARQGNDRYQDEELDSLSQENYDNSLPPPAASNPFERLEEILTGQSPLIQKPLIQSQKAESMEGESMEDIVDEEEQILEDIRKRKEAEPTRRVEVEPEIDTSKSGEENSEGLPELFSNIDEIKKAVIYSEIMNRRY